MTKQDLKSLLLDGSSVQWLLLLLPTTQPAASRKLKINYFHHQAYSVVPNNCIGTAIYSLHFSSRYALIRVGMLITFWKIFAQVHNLLKNIFKKTKLNAPIIQNLAKNILYLFYGVMSGNLFFYQQVCIGMVIW